jgi:Flp pilus assembly protein TadG
MGYKGSRYSSRNAPAERRRRRRRGAEFIEFTFVFLPFLVMMFVLIDVAWCVFVRATLDYAVRAGVRSGITITNTQATAASSNLTAMVKAIVQQKSLGILRNADGLSKIKVRYYQPPADGSTAAAADVSDQASGDSPGNIMQVSIEGYTLPALVPRIFGWNEAPDVNGTTIGAIAADLIEPSHDTPPIGTAP